MTIYMWIYHELFYGYLWKLMGARMDMAVETWEFKCMVELSIMATSFNLPDTWSIAAHFTRPCPGDARGRTAAEGKTSDILLPRSIFSALNTSTCFFFSRFFNHIPAISHGFFWFSHWQLHLPKDREALEQEIHELCLELTQVAVCGQWIQKRFRRNWQMPFFFVTPWPTHPDFLCLS